MDILFVGLRKRQESAGVAAKLRAQAAAFEALGHEVYTTWLDSDGGWLCHRGRKMLLCPYRRRFPQGLSEPYNAAATLLAAGGSASFRLAYIRKPLCDGAHLKALRLLKARGAAVVEEIPTFPYDDELAAQGGIAARAFLAVDRHGRKKLPRYVDFFTNFNRLDSIWGVPGIPIENMVPVDTLQPHRPPPNTGGFHLIGVAAMLFWHGFDRVIRGIAAYSEAGGARPVILHLVGDGPQRGIWQRMARELGVSEQVVFHGSVTGEALDALFAQSHMAVSTLAWHRRGFSHSYALKTREYIARGIPFAYASEDTAAEGVASYCVRLPADDSSIDIGRLLAFYASIQGENYPQAMRQYACQHLKWNSQMQKVLDAIEKQRRVY